MICSVMSCHQPGVDEIAGYANGCEYDTLYNDMDKRFHGVFFVRVLKKGIRAVSPDEFLLFRVINLRG